MLESTVGNYPSLPLPAHVQQEVPAATEQTNITVIQKFGFINGVDNVNWPPYRDSKS